MQANELVPVVAAKIQIEDKFWRTEDPGADDETPTGDPLASSYVSKRSSPSTDFMMMLMLSCVVVAGILSRVASEQVPTWCGKPYEAGAPHIAIPADAWFSYPPKSSTLLLNFQCNPVLKPYISNEDAVGGVILDAEMSYDIGKHFQGSLEDHSALHVSVESGGKILAEGEMRAGTKGMVLEFALKLLGKPTTTPNKVICTAALGSATYTSSTEVHYLPPNLSGGTVTKTDLRTGTLLVKRKDGSAYEPILPFGYYVSTSVLSSQAAVDEIKSKGYVFDLLSAC